MINHFQNNVVEKQGLFKSLDFKRFKKLLKNEAAPI